MKIVNRTIKSGKDNTSHNNIVCVYHIEDFLLRYKYKFKRKYLWKSAVCSTKNKGGNTVYIIILIDF